MPQCSARSKRSGQRCKRLANPASPSGKCVMHGGGSANRPTLSGPDHPNWKGGRFSKDVLAAGGKLAQSFAEHAADPEYSSLRAELALVRSRLSELIERAKDGSLSDRDWSKITNLTDTVARITRVELKREELSAQVLSFKEAQAFAAAVFAAIQDEVEDVATRRRIGGRLRHILMSNGMLSKAADDDNPDDGPIAVVEYQRE